MAKRQKTKKRSTRKIVVPATKLVVRNYRPKGSKRPKGKKLSSAMSDLSACGKAFLKCSLAPADFPPGGENFMGIPDSYDGQTLCKHWMAVNTFPTYTAGNDVYIVQAPIPGVAYLYGQRAAGSTGTIALTAAFYADASTVFPTGRESDIFQAVRYASNVIEIVPTVNQMTWGGSIQAWKGRLTLQEAPTYTVGGTSVENGWVITGTTLFDSTRPASVFNFNDGIYVPGFNEDDTFDFSPIRPGVSTALLNENQAVLPGGSDKTFSFSGSYNIPGLGNFETTVLKFPALPASQTALIRTWTCQEFQLNSTSALYEYSHMSPDHDPLALTLLKEYHRRIPCGVRRIDNADFWENFAKWVRNIASVGSNIPGPVGIISKGVGDLLTYGHGLF